MEGYSMNLVESEAWGRPRSGAGRWLRPAAVGAGLLFVFLLITILIFVARGPAVDGSGSANPGPASQNTCGNLSQQWLQLQSSYSALSENALQLQSSFHTLGLERDALRAERDATRVDRDSLKAQLELLKPDRDALASQRVSLLGELASLKADRDNITLDREFLRLERDALQPERDRLRKERDQLKEEKDAVAAERDGLRAEAGLLRPERDALKIRVDALKSMQEQSRAEMERLVESNGNMTLRVEELQRKYSAVLERTRLTATDMSVAFNSESSGMMFDHTNLMEPDKRRNPRRCSSAGRWARPAAVGCLVLFLLLLMVILILMVQNMRRNCEQASEDFRSQWANLTHRQQEAERDGLREERDALQLERDTVQMDRDALQLERVALRHERDGLKKQTDVCVAEKQRLESDNKGLGAEREALTEERNQLMRTNRNMTEELRGLRTRVDSLQTCTHTDLNNKVCPDNWLKFQNSCYFIPEASQSTTWAASKRECENRAAHLVIINSKQENDAVSKFFPRVWLGLSDTETEGSWKWVDGTGLDVSYWTKGEPNDDLKNEDCAEVRQSTKDWNDVPCSTKIPFICEM